MFCCFGVSVALGKAKINYIYYVLLLAVANKEVVWLHIPVNEVVVVKELQSLYHLVCNHQSSLYCEFPLAKVECVLQTRTKQIHDHRIIVTFYTKPVDRWNAS